MKSLINDIEIGGVKDALNILAKAGILVPHCSIALHWSSLE